MTEINNEITEINNENIPENQVTEGIKKLDVNGKVVRNVAEKFNVVLGIITPHNVLQLKKLNEAVFPIFYNEKFYTEVKTAGDLARLAYFNDVVVGAVCCRYCNIQDERALYIMTLGTLAPYRQFGIGTVLINYVNQLCDKDESIKTASLHVQVNNETALNFYKKNGFEEKGIVENYYRISPPDAYVLVKRYRH